MNIKIDEKKVINDIVCEYEKKFSEICDSNEDCKCCKLFKSKDGYDPDFLICFGNFLLNGFMKGGTEDEI